LEHFAEVPFIPVSKDWLLNKVGDSKLFDAFFQQQQQEEPTSSWKVQQL
jgi:hypothetical protein